jgi:hypothetical protein
MRTVLKTALSQAMLELGFGFLRSGFGKRVAEKIFFRRASFPDVEIANNRNRVVAKRIS